MVTTYDFWLKVMQQAFDEFNTKLQSKIIEDEYNSYYHYK